MQVPIVFRPDPVPLHEISGFETVFAPLPPEHRAWLLTHGAGTLSGWLTLLGPADALSKSDNLQSLLADTWRWSWDTETFSPQEARAGVCLLETSNYDHVIWCPQARNPGYYFISMDAPDVRYLGLDLPEVLDDLFASSRGTPTARILESEQRDIEQVEGPGARFDDVEQALAAALSPDHTEHFRAEQGPGAIHLLTGRDAWLLITANHGEVNVEVFADHDTMKALFLLVTTEVEAAVERAVGKAPPPQDLIWTYTHRGDGPRIIRWALTMTPRAADEQVDISYIVDVLNGPTRGAHVKAEALLLDQDGKPLCLLEATDLEDTPFQPHEARRLNGHHTDQIPKGTVIGSLRPIIHIGLPERLPVETRTRWREPDASGTREVQIFVELNHKGPTAAESQLKVQWMRPNGLPVGDDDLWGDALHHGHQVLVYEASVDLKEWPLHLDAQVEFVRWQGHEPDPAPAVEAPKPVVSPPTPPAEALSTSPAPAVEPASAVEPAFAVDPASASFSAPATSSFKAPATSSFKAPTTSSFSAPATPARATPRPTPAPPAPAPSAPAPPAPEPPPKILSPWDLLADGKEDTAMEIFALGLSTSDQQEVVRWIDAHDPERQLAGMKVARVGGYTNAAYAIRPLLRSSYAQVRQAACETFGELGRSSQAALLRGLTDDPDPLVAEAARQAMQTMLSR